MMSNIAKSFDILAISWNVLRNHFRKLSTLRKKSKYAKHLRYLLVTKIFGCDKIYILIKYISLIAKIK